MPIPYSFCPASSSIFGSCRCLSHPGLLPCSLPDGTLFQPPCLLQGCPASLSLCLHLAPPGQLAGLGLSLMSWGSVPCLPEQDRSPRCPLPGILSAPWYSSMHSPCVAPVREGAGGGGCPRAPVPLQKWQGLVGWAVVRGSDTKTASSRKRTMVT